MVSKITAQQLSLEISVRTVCVIDVTGVPGVDPKGGIKESVRSFGVLEDFKSQIDCLIEHVIASKKKKIVFVCDRGQTRSPSCSQFFLSALKEKNPQNDLQIYYLEGGLSHFQEEFNELCE